MRSERALVLAALAAGILSGATAARADGWVGSWGASDVFPVGQDINYQTLRQFVRLSAGGKEARIRFSNATGLYPLVIGSAHVAKPATDGSPGAIDPATDRALTFGGVGRCHRRAGRGGGVGSRGDGPASFVDARRKHVSAAMDRTLGDLSRRGRHHIHLG